MRNQVVCLFVFLGLSCASGSAQELFSNFESGALGPWSVTDTVVNVEGPRTWTMQPDHFRWIYFGARGLSGQRPEFRIPALSFLGDLRGHEFVWSVDQIQWQAFDQNALDGFDFVFSNDRAFSQDTVFVAHHTPYPVSRMSDYVGDLSKQWHVFSTRSADRELAVGHVQELPLYGFRMTNPLVTAPKRKVVLVGGNHSGEMAGNFALEGFLDFLSGNDPRAKAMRNHADFYVYPLVDPLGRQEGYYRGNSQNPAADHNRFWGETAANDSGFQELQILSSAMRADTLADVDYTFDFHGFFSPGNQFVFTDTPGSETVFLEALMQLDPQIELQLDDAETPAGILEFWAKSSIGLQSDFAFTPELSPTQSVQQWKKSGEHYALALYLELGSPDFAVSPEEIDHLTGVLRNGSTDTQFDLNRDGVVSTLDREFLLAEVIGVNPGDADLNGEVGFADFLVLTAHFDTPSGWGGGDFSGDNRVGFADFLLLSQNFGTAIISVPEPNRMGSYCWLIVMWVLRRRASQSP